VPLTEQRKLALSKKKDATRVKQLRELALSPPKRTSTTAWTVFLGEHLVGHGPGDGNTEGRRWGVDLMKAAGVKYRELSAAQREVRLTRWLNWWTYWPTMGDSTTSKSPASTRPNMPPITANGLCVMTRHKSSLPIRQDFNSSTKDWSLRRHWRMSDRLGELGTHGFFSWRNNESPKITRGWRLVILRKYWRPHGRLFPPLSERQVATNQPRSHLRHRANDWSIQKYEDLVAQDRLRHEQEVKTVYGTNAPLKLPRAAPSESSAAAPDTIV
jgi:hypothetical protein